MRAPRWLAAGAEELAGLAAPLFRTRAWVVASVAAGVAPLCACALVGSPIHQHVSAFLVLPILLYAVRADGTRRGVAVLGIAFGAHCAAAIALARLYPQIAEACLPGGAPYFAKNLRWILTGEDPEYVVANWVFAHVQLVGAMLALGYVSMGIIPLVQGFYEVDLMNYYVGRLLAETHEGPTALALGWHPWSVARGAGFSVLVFEVMSLSYGRFVGRPVSTSHARALRWAVATSFLVLDGAMKTWLLEPVRGALASGLSAR